MKPDIYNDKEGKPQISLDITIINIQFSPFGKPEKSTDNHASHETAPAPEATEQLGIASGTKETTEISLDDEIPF
jgi:single-strand DNA-binding protein